MAFLRLLVNGEEFFNEAPLIYILRGLGGVGYADISATVYPRRFHSSQRDATLIAVVCLVRNSRPTFTAKHRGPPLRFKTEPVSASRGQAHLWRFAGWPRRKSSLFQPGSDDWTS